MHCEFREDWAVHSTATSSGPWKEKRSRSGEPTFAHHEQDSAGEAAAANVRACQMGIAVLHGARGGAKISADDRAVVHAHLAAHLRDAGLEPPPLTSRTELKPVEMRSFKINELRVADENGLPALTGYASVFDSVTDALEMYGFREVFRRGAFVKTIHENDIRALIGHDDTLVLGRNRAGTLRLAEDDHGLAVTIIPPDTSYGRDIVESIRRGDIDQMSIGFQSFRERWSREEGKDTELREILEAKLFDVSVVTYPAYTETQIGVDDRAASKRAADVPDADDTTTPVPAQGAPDQEVHPPATPPVDDGILLESMRRRLGIAEMSKASDSWRTGR